MRPLGRRRLLAGCAILAALLVALAPAVAAQSVPDSYGTLGRLAWGVDVDGHPWTVESLRAHRAESPSDDLSRQTARVLQVAEQQLGTTITPVAHLHTEGVLLSDPAYKASVAATSQLDIVYAWAMCARLADPPLADSCRNTAAQAVTAWTSTYEPSGDPIDEAALFPLLQAVDLMLPLTTPDQQAQALDWCARLGQAGEQLFAGMRPTDTRLLNNWQSWHLAIQAMVATITADQPLLDRTRAAVHQQIAQNIMPTGATYDFQQRDALHYHVYDLEALVQLDLYTGLVAPEDEGAILSAVQFIRPYFVGEQQHVEFVNSPVAFDRQRREAGDHAFDLAPWQPSGARKLLRLARAPFPEIRDWTVPVVDESYAPRIKQIAALYAVGHPDPADDQDAPQS